MTIIIKGSSKEIADFVSEVQNRQKGTANREINDILMEEVQSLHTTSMKCRQNTLQHIPQRLQLANGIIELAKLIKS